MKKLLASVVVMALVVGCETKPAGGPGATPSGSTSGTKPDGTRANKDETFKLKDVSTTDIKQGETHNVHVGINRGKDYHQEVTIAFEGGKGVSVDPAKTSIPADKDEVVVKVSAAKDAPLGETVINYTATPATGTALQGTMKVKVEGATSK